MGLFDFQLDLFQVKKEERKKIASSEFSTKSLVSFRYNPRLRKSIRCSYKGLFGHPEVTLPSYMKGEEFLLAREIVAEWALCANKRKTENNKKQIKELLDRFWGVVDQVLADQGQKTLDSRGRFPPIQPKGTYYDLDQVLAAVNETYFSGELECRITWSRRFGGLSFHSIRKDPITEEPVHVISISRGYDTANCPLYAIAGVVYHECLHIKIPVEQKNGRRVVHGREFKRCEKKYIFYDEWMHWHKTVLPKNLHSFRFRK